MSYVSLYRKYRSQSFGEVIGQDHVTAVLRNAIRAGRVAHAYLFCGPRGCGKTSTARLLARALNCESSDAPTPEPCGTCNMCVRIRDGSAMDVIEMDAASETGIDDVREKIIENAKYAPGAARFKVYIIDEVHDLSLKAFDSLLKTIEEPPGHVVFILATTEAHKVPVTVRSRCQRLDFRRGTVEDLTANLRRVLESERVPYQPEGLAALARSAEGSFRDSLSLLEQVLAYTDGELTADAVYAAVGTVGPELLDEVTEILASDDMNAAFLKAGELVDSGKDVKQTLIALQAHLRDLTVAAIARGPHALPEITPERFARLKEQAARFRTADLLQMLDVLAQAERDVRFTNQHRLLLERAFWSILPSSLPTTANHGPRTTVLEARQEPRAPITRQGGRSDAGPPSAPEAGGHTGPPLRQEPRAPKEGRDGARPLPPEASETANRADSEVGGADSAAIDLEGMRRIWPRVVRRMSDEWSSAKATFNGVEVMELRGNEIVLGFPNEFFRSKVEKPRGQEAVQKALASELGIGGFRIRCVLLEAAGHAPDPGPPPPPGLELLEQAPETVPPVHEAGEPSDADDLLKLVVREFNGKIVDE